MVALFLSLLLPLNSIASDSENYIIASGSQGGNYYATACILADKLNQIDKSFTFQAVATAGSLDNINKLKSRFADFAIVQRDVLLNNLYNKQDGVKNIIVLWPLFDEKFIIYIRGNHPITFNSFKKTAEKHKLKLGVTSKDSTSYETFLTIAQLLSLNLSNIEFEVDTYDGLIDKIKKGVIHGLVTFSLPLEKLEKEKNISFVYFSNKQIKLLQS